MTHFRRRHALSTQIIAISALAFARIWYAGPTANSHVEQMHMKATFISSPRSIKVQSRLLKLHRELPTMDMVRVMVRCTMYSSDG